MIKKELLDILVCPKCHEPVKEDGDELACTGKECGLRYPVRDGIPVMLIEEATRPATGD